MQLASYLGLIKAVAAPEAASGCSATSEHGCAAQIKLAGNIAPAQHSSQAA